MIQSGDLTGQTISHYRLDQLLGKGGMGVVYRASDTRLGRSVALKFFSEAFLESTEAQNRFKREARAASALNHPSICTIHDIDEHHGQPFIVMEYMDGQTLQESFINRRPSVDQLIETAIQITDALNAAHQKGIIHRDIKPANIFMTENGQAKILDFGLAKLVQDPLDSISSMPTAGQPGSGLTTPGTTMGTVAYMSPEQASGEDLDARTDVFSFGVVLYQMATGRHPFEGKTAPVVFKEILTSTPAPVCQLNPDIPVELERIISKALEKERELRYQSAREMHIDLRRLKSGADSQPTVKTYAIPSRASRASRSRIWKVLAPAVFLLLVLLSAVWHFGWFETAPPVSDRSIVVLPFEVLGEDSGQFSKGFTYAVITQLSRLGDLRVTSRTTSMGYADSQLTLKEISSELGVANVLEGTVQRAGNQVQVVAQLIDAESDTLLWAETYNRDVDDLFEIQNDLAGEIANALRIELGPEEKGGQVAGELTAYDYYLMGKSYHKLGLLEEAERHLREAKKRDPGHFSFPQLALARLYEDLDRHSDAAMELDEFLELHSESEMRESVELWREAVRTRE